MLKLFFTTAIVATLALPTMAQEQPCAPAEQVFTRLADKYGEAPVSVGEGQNGALVITTANTENGTWTTIVLLPSGLGCLVASGENFRLYEAVERKGVAL